MTSWRPLGISSCPGDGFSVLENCRKVGLGNSSFQKGRPQKPQKKTGSSPGCHHVFFSEAMLTLVTLTLVREVVSYVRSSGRVCITSEEAAVCSWNFKDLKTIGSQRLPGRCLP